MTRSQYRRAAHGLTLALVLISLAGCSGRPAVQGTVTFDGASVDDGAISFVPAGGAGSAGPVGVKVADGKYTIGGDRGLAPGSYRVEITWKKKTGKTVPTPGDPAVQMPETKQVIPPRYNTRTELTADITSGSNTKDFELKQ
jgi:hypothetical protein